MVVKILKIFDWNHVTSCVRCFSWYLLLHPSCNIACLYSVGLLATIDIIITLSLDMSILTTIKLGRFYTWNILAVRSPQTKTIANDKKYRYFLTKSTKILCKFIFNYDHQSELSTNQMIELGVIDLELIITESSKVVHWCERTGT